MWKLSFSILVILGLNATMPLSSCVLRALGIPSLADLRYLENTIPGPQNGTLWAIWEIAITHHGADTFSCLPHYQVFEPTGSGHATSSHRRFFMFTTNNTCLKEAVLHDTGHNTEIICCFDLRTNTIQVSNTVFGLTCKDALGPCLHGSLAKMHASLRT